MTYKNYPEPSSVIEDGTGRGKYGLENFWQPLYHGRYLTDPNEWPNNRGLFFQREAFDKCVGNLQTAGCMTWPKHYYIWELQFLFPEQDVEVDRLYSEIVVGEKPYLTLALQLFDPIGPSSYKTYLQKPIYIPPVQNFYVKLGGQELPDIAYCALHGYLQREVQ